MNKYSAKVQMLQKKRGWTAYELSQASGVWQQTISKWYGSEVVPTLPNLEQVCEAFNITLADFFSEGNLIELTPEKKALHDDWCSLTKSEQDAVKAIIKSYKDNK